MGSGSARLSIIYFTETGRPISLYVKFVLVTSLSKMNLPRGNFGKNQFRSDSMNPL